MILFLNYKGNFVTDFVKSKVGKVENKFPGQRWALHKHAGTAHRPPSIYTKDQTIHEGKKKKPMFKSLKVHLCTGNEGAIMTLSEISILTQPRCIYFTNVHGYQS